MKSQIKAILFTLKQYLVLAGILASYQPRWGLGSAVLNFGPKQGIIAR